MEFFVPARSDNFCFYPLESILKLLLRCCRQPAIFKSSVGFISPLLKLELTAPDINVNEDPMISKMRCLFPAFVTGKEPEGTFFYKKPYVYKSEWILYAINGEAFHAKAIMVSAGHRSGRGSSFFLFVHRKQSASWPKSRHPFPQMGDQLWQFQGIRGLAVQFPRQPSASHLGRQRNPMAAPQRQ